MQEAERSRRSTTGARGDGTDSMAGGPLGLAGRKSGLLESATSGVVRRGLQGCGGWGRRGRAGRRQSGRTTYGSLHPSSCSCEEHHVA